MPRLSINIIRVGSDQFTSTDEGEISSAVAFTRNTYATIGLTLDRVQNFGIPTALANGREIIDSDGEAVTGVLAAARAAAPSYTARHCSTSCCFLQLETKRF